MHWVADLHLEMFPDPRSVYLGPPIAYHLFCGCLLPLCPIWRLFGGREGGLFAIQCCMFGYVCVCVFYHILGSGVFRFLGFEFWVF